MIATDFARNDCRLGGRRVTYQTLEREYCCNECGGRIVRKWNEELGYHVVCGRCGSFDFIHENQLQQEKHDRIVVADSLPPHITRQVLEEESKMIRDRTRRNRITRAGIIRLGYRVFRCRSEGCREEIRWHPGAITCPQCGLTHREMDQRYTYPRAADHFVLRDAPEIQDHYGPNGEPVREIDVMMLFPSIADNVEAAYQIWAGGIVVCEGDGQQVSRARPMVVRGGGDSRVSVHQGSGRDLVRDGKALRAFTWGEHTFETGDEVPCAGIEGIRNESGYPQCAACGMNAVLKVAIAVPELFDYVYYQLATGSWRNYDTIMTVLERVRGDRRDPTTGEMIAGTRPVNTVRFRLGVEEESSAYFDEKSGKLRPSRKYFLQMVPWRQDMLRILNAERQALMGAGAPRLRPPDGVEEDDFFDPEGPIGVGEEVEVEAPAPPPVAEVDAQSAPQASGGTETSDELPSWALELRRQASDGAGADVPENPGAITGMVRGLARKVDSDEERIREFLTVLWGREPEELTRSMYRLTVDLNGQLEQYLKELEAHVGHVEAVSSPEPEEEIPF